MDAKNLPARLLHSQRLNGMSLWLFSCYFRAILWRYGALIWLPFLCTFCAILWQEKNLEHGLYCVCCGDTMRVPFSSRLLVFCVRKQVAFLGGIPLFQCDLIVSESRLYRITRRCASHFGGSGGRKCILAACPRRSPRLSYHRCLKTRTLD